LCSGERGIHKQHRKKEKFHVTVASWIEGAPRTLDTDFGKEITSIWIELKKPGGKGWEKRLFTDGLHQKGKVRKPRFIERKGLPVWRHRKSRPGPDKDQNALKMELIKKKKSVEALIGQENGLKGKGEARVVDCRHKGEMALGEQTSGSGGPSGGESHERSLTQAGSEERSSQDKWGCLPFRRDTATTPTGSRGSLELRRISSLESTTKLEKRKSAGWKGKQH